MAVLLIGLTPIFPTIEVVPVEEMPDFDRIAKLPADPRFTAAGPAALTAEDRKRTEAIARLKIRTDKCLYMISSTSNALLDYIILCIKVQYFIK
jgi:hypothetical protein